MSNHLICEVAAFSRAQHGDLTKARLDDIGEAIRQEWHWAFYSDDNTTKLMAALEGAAHVLEEYRKERGI